MNLPRTLEPATFTAAAEAAIYGAMDHSVVNAAFVDDLCDGGPVGPRVVDLGCGPAAIAIVLAGRLPGVRVMAVDLQVEMLEIAKREIDIAGLLDQIQLQHADVTAMSDFEDQMADTVISNSVLHHLTDPAAALAQAVRLVRGGGRVFIRDLVRPASTDDVESLVARHAAGEPPEAAQLLRQSLHASLTIAEARNIARAFGIASESVQMTSDRHWTLDWCRPE